MFYFLRIMKHQFVCYNSSNQELCTPQPNLSAVLLSIHFQAERHFPQKKQFIENETKPVELCARFV